MIPARSYFTPDVLDAELAQLFADGFQFVATMDELANDRDFVCLDHAGASIVVQNFKGELKAFNNVCSHRFKRIQDQDRGNRPLTCMYHGWSYDKTGFPAGLPKRAQFGEATPERDAALCLTPYRVETCGRFVFVRMSGAGGLREQLGSFFEVLEALGPHIGAEVHRCEVPHQANWKLLVENVVECYHCAIIHPETFVASGFGKATPDRIAIEGGNSSFHLPRLDARDEPARKRFLSHLKDRTLSHDSFHHIHIFPNLFIASTEGMHFYIGQALPRSATETILRVRYMEPALPFASWKRSRQDLVNAETTRIGLGLIGEDRAILESIQRGIRFADKPGLLGEEEIRIKAFMSHYADRMTLASGDPDLRLVTPVARQWA